MKIIVGVCAFKKKYYQSKIQCVEVQRTFYNIPQEKTLRKWREEAPESFIFNIKAFQGFTHTAKSPTWRRYSKRITDEFKEKVGDLKLNDLTKTWIQTYSTYAKILHSPVIVIQTPASFRPTEDNIKRAYQFFEYFEDVLRKTSSETYLGWEPRGKWLEKPQLREIIENFDRLIHIVDPFYHEPVIVKEITYFRLHGKPYLNYKYKYSSEDLRKLHEKILGLSSERVFVMFNNVYMETNATQFLKILES